MDGSMVLLISILGVSWGIIYYSTVWNLRNQEIESETLIFAPISLSYIEID